MGLQKDLSKKNLSVCSALSLGTITLPPFTLAASSGDGLVSLKF